MATHPYPTRIRRGSRCPRGEFCLADDGSPVMLLSAGIGATPVLAMAHALAAAHRDRQVWWLHTTHNAESHVFGAEVTSLIKSLPHGQQRVFTPLAMQEIASSPAGVWTESRLPL